METDSWNSFETIRFNMSEKTDILRDRTTIKENR